MPIDYMNCNERQQVFDGGAIHERRHALTWAISDGVSWDDTDLTT